MTLYTVIGSSGFIGSHVMAALRSAGSDPQSPAREDTSLWQRHLGRVIYCAGLTGDFRTLPFAAVEAHVSLLGRLLAEASYERIVYLSSTRLYHLLDGGIGTEDRSVPVNPADPEHLYELSKMLGENLILRCTNGRGTVARLSYVYGWDQDAQGFLSDWLRSARQSRSLKLDSSPAFARDYIHVDDVAQALIAMVDSDESGIVNVARGETLSNAEIAAVFEDQGWNVQFSRKPNGEGRTLPISAAKLGSLGVKPRPVLPMIREYLAGLSVPLT